MSTKEYICYIVKNFIEIEEPSLDENINRLEQHIEKLKKDLIRNKEHKKQKNQIIEDLCKTFDISVKRDDKGNIYFENNENNEKKDD